MTSTKTTKRKPTATSTKAEQAQKAAHLEGLIAKLVKQGVDPQSLVGREFTSVTTPFQAITLPALAVWKATIGEDIAQSIATKAANMGTHIHEACEAVVYEFMGVQPESACTIRPKYRPHAAYFKAWLVAHVERVLFVERTVYSDELSLLGALDIGYVLKALPEAITIGDIKTGRVKPIADLQMAAYGKLLPPDVVDGRPIHRQILPIPRKLVAAELTAIDCSTPIDEDWQLYLKLLDVWRWMQAHESAKKERESYGKKGRKA